MPGNSFSQDRSTYGCTCSSSQTSPALYSLGVTRASIPASLARGAVRTLLSPPGSDVEANRRSLEPEALPQLVDEKPLVGKVKLRRDVGEEDERRRGDAGLRRVEDAHVRAPRAGRRMRRGDLRDELVQFRRLHALPARHGN